MGASTFLRADRVVFQSAATPKSYREKLVGQVKSAEGGRNLTLASAPRLRSGF